MFYYEQVDRETKEYIALLTCSEQLQDNHPTIELFELTEEEYNQLCQERIQQLQEQEILNENTANEEGE